MFDDADLTVRPHPTDPRGRSLLEQMVHQSVSEHFWFSTMLGISVTDNPIPSPETRVAFIRLYVENARLRLTELGKTRGRLVGSCRPVLRGSTVSGLDHDPPYCAHRASPRPTDRTAADDQPATPQHLRAHRRYRGSDATSGSRRLRVSRRRHPAQGGASRAPQDPAAGPRSPSGNRASGSLANRRTAGSASRWRHAAGRPGRDSPTKGNLPL